MVRAPAPREEEDEVGDEEEEWHSEEEAPVRVFRLRHP